MSDKMRKLFITAFLICCITPQSPAQRVGIKTNALYWAAGGTPNLSAEFGLGKRSTLEITGGYNPWTLNKETNKKMKHWLVMPEFRYWFCERFQGHFLGLHAGYTYYNIGGIRIPFQNRSSSEHRYQGWATGIGISYGYTWIIGRRWNLEATLGLGYAYSDYDKYDCPHCGEFRGNEEKHYFGPTKTGISIIYMIK